jgi:hypothetical protein
MRVVTVRSADPTDRGIQPDKSLIGDARGDLRTQPGEVTALAHDHDPSGFRHRRRDRIHIGRLHRPQVEGFGIEAVMLPPARRLEAQGRSRRHIYEDCR